MNGVAISDAVTANGGSGPHVSTFGLIVTALTMSSLTVILHLELVVRSALILSVAAFVPLVSVLSIWPRAVGAAIALSEFLVGLLLSKFVVATVVYVGFRLVVVALISPTDTDATENWMASGVAVLLIAAFSPVIIFSALRFAHGSAGSIARGWAGNAVSLAPAGKLIGGARNALRPLTRPIGQHISSKITARLARRAPRGRRGRGAGEPASRPVPPPPANEEPWLLDSRAVSRLLGIGRTKTFQMMATAELPTVRIGRCVRVPRESLLHWVLRQAERETGTKPLPWVRQPQPKSRLASP